VGSTGAPGPGDEGVADLDRLTTQACIEALAPLFEGAPRFLARLAAARPFGDRETLVARAREIAHGMPEPEQVELVDAHPRLGAPRGSVSELSFREQGYDCEPAESAAAEGAEAAATAEVADRARLATELARLNAAYERRFGFRYCVFVAGRPRAALVADMEASLRASRATELHRALDSVVDIAADRMASGGRRVR
jgi:2-oxo-4-hydroxy-4-carboxy-5-ureidoimidazoline decarboxylase